MNWKNWLMGLFWAFVTGAGTGITMVITDPEHYNFGEGWKRLVGVSAAFGLLAAGSYLKDSRKQDDNIIDKFARSVPVILIAAALAASVACAHPRHAAVIGDAALYEALADVHAIEQRALCGQSSCAGVAVAPAVPGWTLEKSQAFNAKLLPAVEAGRQFNQVLATWQPGQPAPAQLHTEITAIGDALQTVAASFPDGVTKQQLISKIATAQAIVLQALDIFLSVKGS